LAPCQLVSAPPYGIFHSPVEYSADQILFLDTWHHASFYTIGIFHLSNSIFRHLAPCQLFHHWNSPLTFSKFPLTFGIFHWTMTSWSANQHRASQT
jgi:hypothetical protein